MDTERQSSPLIVVVGPTASGKSALAMELARKFDGEIICADSRTVYKGMDIGTAKPSKEEQAEIPHHLLDVIRPDEAFTAALFKELATKSIDDITARGKLPIMVGGTGLYIDGVIFDYAFLPPAPQEERDELEKLDVETLQKKLSEQNIPLPENSKNPRHLIRALETNGAVAVKKGLRKNTLVLGLDITKEELTKRITLRTDAMIKQGLEQEAQGLAQEYGWEAPGLTAVGYREWRVGGATDKASEAITRNTIQYAKRQRTWFKRNPHIKWLKNSAEAEALLKYFLQQSQSN